MRIFVTGGTGFIGGAVVRRLARTDHDLFCLVRTTSDVCELRQLNATLVAGDVTDKASIRAGMAECDWLVHLANVYSFWERDKRVYARVNIQGTRNVIECALEAGIEKMIHISTCAVYGKPAVTPFVEDTPVGPKRFSEYAVTKYAGDQVVWDFHERHGLPVAVVYPGAVLGPGDQKSTGRYIQNLVAGRMPAAVFPDSSITCVHVKDVAEAIVRALEKDGNIGERYLIGKEILSFRAINELVAEIAGVSVPRRTMPPWAALAMAQMGTLWANITKRPPYLGLSVDMARTMQYGFQFDGSKAERELGLVYTPARAAVEEAIASYRRAAL